MQSPSTVRRTIAVVDVARFSASDRDDLDRRAIRATLRDAVLRAFDESGIDHGRVLRKDTGDGMILLIPEEVALPDRLLFPWLANLEAGLRQANHTASAAARVQVRVAVHGGYLHVDAADGDGTSSDLVLACRLVDADDLKRTLAGAPDAVLALVVSDAVYDGVVRHHPRGVDPATYRQASVTVKETTARAWIHLPGTRPVGHARDASPAAPPAPGAGTVTTTFNAPVTVHGDLVSRDKHDLRRPDTGS